MSLVHPIIRPQVALRACTGKFFGTQEEWVAILYSDRIVFTLSAKLKQKEPLPKSMASGVAPNNDAKRNGKSRNDDDDDDNNDEFAEDIIIKIPQPPMTIGNPDADIAPTLGGAFFAVGRNRDMLAMQFRNCLCVLSINAVTNQLELQGIWGLPKPKELSASGFHGKLGHHSRVPSAASLIALAEQASISSGASSAASTISSASGPSGLALCSQFPEPKPSPDGTMVFVVSKNKYQNIVLLILTCYGREIIKVDADYLNVLTTGWIQDDIVYFVYLNRKFHKKFQVCRLANKTKASGFLGMGRKSVKPSFVFDTNIHIALDYQPYQRDVTGAPDLVFKDYVLLGTKGGSYMRVNYKSGTWEPVLNARNIVGAVDLGDKSLIVQTTKRGGGTASSVVPTSASEFSFAVITEGTMHALAAQPEVTACLSTKHDIDGGRRYLLKLLHIGGGIILDYRRRPFRLYRFRSNPTNQLLLYDKLPLPNKTSFKLTRDFLVKTEQALYTRDNNGDDNRIFKVIDRCTQLEICVERPGLLTVDRRDIKSLYAGFTKVPGYNSQVVIIDESQSRIFKMKEKASFNFGTEFGGAYKDWYLSQLKTLHRNVVIVTLTSVMIPTDKDPQSVWTDDFSTEWIVCLISFVGSTSKKDANPPKGHIIFKSKTPEVEPPLFNVPANTNQFTLPIYNTTLRTFTKRICLDVNIHGEYKVSQPEDTATPIAVDQSDGVTFFTDYNGPLDGLYMAGTYDRQNRIDNVLLVETPRVINGNSVILSGVDPFRTVIWVFDSNGVEFREFNVQDVRPERKVHQGFHENSIKIHQQKSPAFKVFQLSPDFKQKVFSEVSSHQSFRPLPEIPALITRGVGSGVDAEVYLKTPDHGLFAIFRMQNKKLHESLSKLERVILDRIVGAWLPDELRASWIEETKGPSMINGDVFDSYWDLPEEKQQELCEISGVDSALIKRIRPPS